MLRKVNFYGFEGKSKYIFAIICVWFECIPQSLKCWIFGLWYGDIEDVGSNER
jgi:hypothetical protein